MIGVIITTLFTSGGVLAQIYGSDGWQATESDFACNRSDPTIYNVTGSLSVQGFAPPANLPNASLGTIQTLTFTTGVVDFLVSTNISQHSAAQEYWVQATPDIDMGSEDMPYYGYSAAISGLPRQVYEKGLNDSGDCTTLFNAECVSAMLTQAKNASLGFITNPSNPVKDGIIWPPPSACSQFTTNGNWIGYVSSLSAYIGASSGPPEYSYCNATNSLMAMESVFVGDVESEPLGSYSNYDAVVTEIHPMVTAVWSKDAQNPWSDARLACIHLDKFREGSRVPTAIPSVGVPRSSRRNATLALVAALFWVSLEVLW